MMNKKTLTLAVLQAIGTGALTTLVVSTVHAQRVPADISSPTQTITREQLEGLPSTTNVGEVLRATPSGQPVVVEKMQITGSSIKRVQGEGPAPVETHTRADIERTGATNVNELIRSIPSIDIFDQGELASNSPSGSGSANIRLRGLDETNVLVLLNGRRLPVNALYDASGAGAAVDINMIPISAIERVEILKDGGSAIYGADAVAGVINFITKKDYNGLEATIGYGQSSRSDGTEKSIGVTGGFGNLDENGYNVILAINSFERDPIFRKDREISRSVDFRRFGGPDARSSFAPQGNFLDPATGRFSGESMAPCPPELFTGRCRYDFNASLLTAYNGADRQGAMALGTVKITPDIRGYAQLFHGRAKDTFEAHPVPDFFVVSQGTGLIAGRFMQGGPRMTNRKSTLDHFVLGVEGTTAGIDWDVAYSQGKSKVTNRDSNYYNANLWIPATESGAINPTVTTNDPAFVESLKVSPIRAGESEIKALDGKISGELMQMPAGRLAYAVGGSIWKETLVDTPDPLTQQGLVVGSIQQAPVNAERDAKAIFGELNIPVLKNLEVQAAVRRDDYDTAAKTSPKIAARWKVIPELAFRASYTESFRMPSLKQLYGAQEEGAININNQGGASNCQHLGLAPDCDIAAFEVQGSNPNLKPEKGKTFNVGAIFDVGNWVSGTIDYWKVQKDDSISQPTIDQAIAAGNFARQGTPVRTVVFTNLQNFAKVETEGVDLDLASRIGKTPVGALTLRNFTSYQLTNRRQNGPGAEWENLRESYATPKWRNTFSATLDNGPWSTTVAWRYTGGFYDSDVYPTGSNPRPANQRHVPGYDEVDLLLSYAGFKNLKLNLGVKNILDAQPPFSLQNVSSNAYTQMGFAELYTSRGRFYFVNATYTFK